MHSRFSSTELLKCYTAPLETLFSENKSFYREYIGFSPSTNKLAILFNSRVN